MRPMLVSKTAVGPVGWMTVGALEVGASGSVSAAGGVDCWPEVAGVAGVCWPNERRAQKVRARAIETGGLVISFMLGSLLRVSYGSCERPVPQFAGSGCDMRF